MLLHHDGLPDEKLGDMQNILMQLRRQLRVHIALGPDADWYTHILTTILD